MIHLHLLMFKHLGLAQSIQKLVICISLIKQKVFNLNSLECEGETWDTEGGLELPNTSFSAGLDMASMGL